MCACMDINTFGMCSSLLQSLTNFSPFLFRQLLQQTTADTDMCDITFAVSYGLPSSLPTSSLSESALILPSIVPSPPITQNQEKHTPTRDWGSDKIKHTRRLIWITGARSIKIVRDSEPDRETETGVYRARKEGIISEKGNRE